MLVPEKVWTPALDADGGVRAGGDVAELTELVDLSRWPAGMRVIVRRERPHPGARRAGPSAHAAARWPSMP
jgi:hypothetical protein